MLISVACTWCVFFYLFIYLFNHHGRYAGDDVYVQHVTAEMAAAEAREAELSKAGTASQPASTADDDSLLPSMTDDDDGDSVPSDTEAAQRSWELSATFTTIMR